MWSLKLDPVALLDDRGEDVVTLVAVRPLASRLEHQRRVRDRRHRSQCAGQPRNSTARCAPLIPHAGRMRQQVSNGHFTRTLGIRVARQNLRERVVQTQFALIDQPKDRGRGEHLPHRCERESRAHRVGNAVLKIGEPERSLVDNRVASRDVHDT